MNSIKRIVFDVDDTLIMWNNDYYVTLNQTLEHFNIDYNEEIKKNLIRAVDNYDSIENMFNFKTMNDLMKEYTNINLPDNFVEVWTKYLENAVPEKENIELMDTLEYLSNKYELVVLTNWFTHQQAMRLENHGILKYFKEVIGTDTVKNKPYEESYLKACGDNKPSECIMIGDSITKDYEGAINVGMQAILFDGKNKYTGNNKNIKKISELKNIL